MRGFGGVKAAVGASVPTGTPGGVDYVLLLVLAAIWGSSFLFIKMSVDVVPPATMTAIRVSVATLIILPFAIAGGRALTKGWRMIGLVALAGLFGNALPFTLIAWGQQEIDAGLAAILMGTMPLFTLLLAHFFTHDEKLNRLKVLAVILGFAGIAILIGPHKLVQLGSQVIAQLSVACGALCYAVNAIISKRLTGEPRMAVAASLMFAATLMMWPLAWVTEFSGASEPVLGNATWFDIATVILLGAVHTGLATLIMFRLITSAGATFFSQINFLVPVFGVVWGATFLGERPGINAILALSLILAGIALARRGQRRPPTARGQEPVSSAPRAALQTREDA
ncbi:DMT family transporter [Tepidamorphus sp. 3E244]|uniref:DMT family transporter n=1 Tax=Tepidamorphus sp. 3E244 TaxID=3385498 RepID=UPI0038FC1190